LLPAGTTVMAAVFALAVLRRWWVRRSGPHLLWWGGGLWAFGVGTCMEAIVTIWGWQPVAFRIWYVAGALLGGAPLAQGTVYLLLRRRTAHRLTAVLVPYLLVAAVCVLAAPLDVAGAEPQRLSGAVLAWPWVRLLTPPVNLYAAGFLVGGAVLSAWRFRLRRETRHRVIGNALIAVGALLPGIGGAATRFGFVELLYVTEFVGLSLIWMGYRWNVREVPPPRP
jgi:hypothetical protein